MNNALNKQPSESENISDSYVRNAHIVSFKNAMPKFDFTSEYILHYPGDIESVAFNPSLKVATLEKPPKIDAENTKNNHEYSYWTAKSEQAWLNSDATQIRMEKNVIIIKTSSKDQSFFQLETSILWIWPKKEYAKSDKYVKITSNQAEISAIGMNANLQTTQYHLLSDVHVKLKR